jgi:uncharacterized membrane protein YcfT
MTRDLDPTPADGPAQQRRRDKGLDALRGLAIVLMIVDHVLVAQMYVNGWSSAAEWTRLTVTRLSMPLFMIVSGYFMTRSRPFTVRRLVQIGIAAIYINVLMETVKVGFDPPEILAVWLMVMILAPLMVRFPIELAMLGILQTLYQPIGWPGYEPGNVVAFLCLGILFRERQNTLLRSVGTRLPSWMSAIGRHPLAWYLGHLTVIILVAAAIEY